MWISEFGVGGRDETGQKQRDWFRAFTGLLVDADADFAYWPLIGWGGRNGWALLQWSSSGERRGLYNGDDWRGPSWAGLVGSPAFSGPVPLGVRWSMLSPDRGDFVQSQRLRAGGDWHPGSRKAACPGGQRLAGLSRSGNRGLCVSSPVPGRFELVTDERYVGADWASGYTKLQCPPGHLMVGWSVRGSFVAGAMCAASSVATRASGRTVWFDRGDNRPASGGDFATGHYKGHCADAEYVAGVAFTRRIGSSAAPAALLCV